MENIETGLAGEFRIMSELILRGDNGIDIILDSGKRIQVKSSKRNGRRFYRFSLRKGNKKEIVDLATYCDFLICWGIEEDMFWIIPTNKLKRRTSLSLSQLPKHRSLYGEYLGNWNLLCKGGEQKSN